MRAGLINLAARLLSPTLPVNARHHAHEVSSTNAPVTKEIWIRLIATLELFLAAMGHICLGLEVPDVTGLMVVDAVPAGSWLPCGRLPPHFTRLMTRPCSLI